MALLVSWMYLIVPVTVETIPLDMNLGEVSVVNLASFLIFAAV